MLGMSRSLLRFALVFAASVAGTVVHAEDPKPSGTTVTFPYKQKKLLYSKNGNGGLAYVTPGDAGATLPTVVFLHGMNPDAVVHMWLGERGDLRPLADKLVAGGKTARFILAGPTHSRYATGATVMWHDFDLDAFLDATDAALVGKAKVDRKKVIVVAHSGGGCNTTGGLFAQSTTKPVSVLAVDTCVDEKTNEKLAELAKTSDVRVTWQKDWKRPIEDLERACATCKVEELVDLGSQPHNAILPETLNRTLPQILPP